MGKDVFSIEGTEVCVLCNSSLPKHPIIDETNVFCCMGCHAVYKVLSAKDQLANYRDHPLFKQAVRTGIISNPFLNEANQSAPPSENDEEIEKLYLEIKDMWCPSCAKVIGLILSQEKGIRSCHVDYATDFAIIDYIPRHISKDKITAIISSLGYIPASLDEESGKQEGHLLLFRFIIAAFLSLNLMMFSYPIYASYFHLDSQGYASLFTWLSLAAVLPVVTYCAWPIYRHLAISLRWGLWGMEILIAIGIASTFFLSIHEMFWGNARIYFDSLSVIVTLVLLGKILEAKAKFSAKDTLLRLYKALPRKVRKRFADGSQQYVPIKDLQLGDIFIVVSGEKIVTDGIVEEGNGACDESIITGEVLPIAKEKDMPVIGGSVLLSGWLACKVHVEVKDSSLHRILETINQELRHKSEYVRLTDIIVRWFVPAVIFIAMLTATIGYFFYHLSAEESVIRAVAVLLISCPCAIGIAVPIAESHLINSLAKLGALVRNRKCLRYLGKETTYVFDKTGTVTEGKFTLLTGLEGLTDVQRKALKSLASQSIHPMSKAITEAIDGDIDLPLHIEEFAGRGIRAMIDKCAYHLGSLDFMEQHGIVLSCEGSAYSLERMASTVYFAEDGRCVAMLKLGDTIREGVKSMIRDLSAQSAKTVLLSGDTPSTVAHVAKECDFSIWIATCHPMQKRDYIQQLREQGEVICMVGDGINDAPALTNAHVGISVASAADISIQVSDILLTKQTAVIPSIVALAKKGNRIVKQNLFWAFIYNLLGIPLAIFGVLSPIFAAFAMVASSLMVVLNAQRLNK